MSFPYYFYSVALKEYKTAVTWYLDKSKQAAENFVKEVTATIQLICRDPNRFRKTYKSFQETSLKKFPFSVVYYFDKPGERIIIFSLYHHKRNPKRKFKKLR